MDEGLTKYFLQIAETPKLSHCSLIVVLWLVYRIFLLFDSGLLFLWKVWKVRQQSKKPLNQQDLDQYENLLQQALEENTSSCIMCTNSATSSNTQISPKNAETYKRTSQSSNLTQLSSS